MPRHHPLISSRLDLYTGARFHGGVDCTLRPKPKLQPDALPVVESASYGWLIELATREPTALLIVPILRIITLQGLPGLGQECYNLPLVPKT